jgi:hypothetical protein
VKRAFEITAATCLITVAAVIILSPLWLVAIGFWFTTIARLKCEGISILTGVAGFVFAWPYGVFAKTTAEKLQLFP